MKDENIYPFPNLNDGTLSMLEWKLNHVKSLGLDVNSDCMRGFNSLISRTYQGIGALKTVFDVMHINVSWYVVII